LANKKAQPENAPSFLKFVEKNVDFSNLKSRLRVIFYKRFVDKSRGESVKLNAKK
jgi:hypothetical protein